MSRRLRLDRMADRARGVRTIALLRDSAAEVRAKVESGEWTVNRARAAYGLPSLGPAGTVTAKRRPDDLAAAMAWHGIAPPEFTIPAPWDDKQVAEWQRYWDETMAAGQPHRQQLITLPGRTTIRPGRPRKSAPRGLPRMRKHRRELLINALRWDGPYAVLKAYRFLPDELGLPPLKPPADETEQLAADYGLMAAHLSFEMRDLLPPGLEFEFDPKPTETDPNGDPS